MAKKRAIYARKEIFRILLLAFFVATSSFLVSPQDNIHAATIEHNLVKYSKSKMTRLTLKKVYSAKRGTEVCASCNGSPKCKACDGRGYKIRYTTKKK